MFLKVGILLMALGISLFAIGGIVIQKTGLMIVDVQDRDRHIFLPIPMIFVNSVLHFAPVATRINMPDEINRNYGAVQAATQELINCPDGPLVEVSSPRENVLIEKRGGNLIVDVKSDREKVFLQIPIQASGKAIAQLSNFKSPTD